MSEADAGAVMTIIEYPTGRAGGASIASPSRVERRHAAPFRFRGWLLLSMGLGSWAGLLKLFGWI